MKRMIVGILEFLCCLAGVFPCFALENFLEFPGGVRVLYWSRRPLEAGSETAEYAVVFVHGLSKRTKDLTPGLKKLIRQDPRAGKVVFVQPAFVTEKSCPPKFQGKIAAWDLKQHDWRCGDLSIGERGVSSYAVIDRICELLADRGRYPNLKHILICGFSAGGQVVNRYVAVGGFVRREQLEYSFAVGAPSTYLYVDRRRPTPDGAFREPEPEVPGHDAWHFGLEKRNAYASYLSEQEIMENFRSRPTLYLCGEEDVTKRGLASSPGAMTQGENRYRRFLNYQRYVGLFPGWAERSRFVAVPGAGHQTMRVFAAPEFVRLVFGERE